MEPANARLTGLLLTILLVATGGCHTFRRQAVEEHVASSRDFSLRGMAAFEEGDHQQAKGLLEQAVRTFPKDFRARRRYADSLFALGEIEEAIFQMEQAVRLSGNDPPQLIRLGELHFSQGNFDYASLLVENALQGNPNLAIAWTLKARIAQQNGNDDEAKLAYLKALDEGATLESVAIPLAHIYFSTDKPLRAYSLLQRLEQQSELANSQIPQLTGMKGIALKRLGRTQQAIPVLQEAIEKDPRSQELVAELVGAHIALGDLDNARLSLQAGRQRAGESQELARLSNQLEVLFTRLASRTEEYPDSDPEQLK